MFKGFKLPEIDFDRNEIYYLIGEKLYSNYDDHIKKSLNSFLSENKFLDGSEIIESWFPQINSHVFISHSHNDNTLAITLAGWLYHNFRINSFIDSCIWGYGNDLIKQLDNAYSWLNQEKGIYEYKKVLDSTGHVHMMLSTALSSMMDKTECLIFLDTPNSVAPFNEIDKTESPWIYSEIAISQVLRQNIPPRIEIKQLSEERTELFSGDIGEIKKALNLNIKYDLNNKHLIEIDEEILDLWSGFENLKNPEDALDKLYEITTPTKPIKFTG